MYAEDIYIAASAMCADESETLGLFCSCAETELSGRLKQDVNVSDIKPLFITAAAMLAVSMYFASGGDSVKSWSAGQVSVTGGASWQDLRDRAEMLMAGYIDAGSGFDFRGVMG